MKMFLPQQLRVAFELFASSPDLIFAVNAKGIVRGSCNPAALSALQRLDRNTLFPNGQLSRLLAGQPEVRGTFNGQRAVWCCRQLPGTQNVLVQCSTRLGTLEQAATTDPLTGWLNKGEFLVALGEQDNNQLGALLMIDLDRFGPFNNTYGHGAGDSLLIAATTEIQRVVRQVVRSNDSCYRYGGEELVVWLRGLVSNREFTKSVVRSRAEAIQAAVREIRLDDVSHPPVTVSIGVVWIEPGSVAKTEYGKADQALYYSKESGRDRVTFYEDVPATWLAERARKAKQPEPIQIGSPTSPA